MICATLINDRIGKVRTNEEFLGMADEIVCNSKLIKAAKGIEEIATWEPLTSHVNIFVGSTDHGRRVKISVGSSNDIYMILYYEEINSSLTRVYTSTKNVSDALVRREILRVLSKIMSDTTRYTQ